MAVISHIVMTLATPSEMSEFQKTFNIVDLDKDGKIGVEDLTNAFKKYLPEE